MIREYLESHGWTYHGDDRYTKGNPVVCSEAAALFIELMERDAELRFLWTASAPSEAGAP